MTGTRTQVLGLSGSLRRTSSNTTLLSWVGRQLPAGSVFRLYEGLAELPHFNPDTDAADGGGPAVEAWRQALKAADAVVICTPEYACGVPGSLKNALDWAVSSGELTSKPVALISASPHSDGGATALHSLRQTVEMMGAEVREDAVLPVSFVGKRLGPEGSVTDPDLADALCSLIQAVLKIP
ncbi:NADPH-dependent FMN reductase [Gorillibacterium sp. sgz5001074]|uniref:NADPH-dependent FMN reductase n=1 Tax=Gorillibacterium sp. sgz5001074 TaxID=3446695 RepID=UPI003F67D679